MSELVAVLLLIASAAVVLWIGRRILSIKRVVVYEYQRALKYTKGRIRRRWDRANIGYFPGGRR